MDEVIFFRRPPETSHLLLFNLPKPPNHIEQDELYQVCSQYGQLYDCTIRYTTAAVGTEENTHSTQPPSQNDGTQQQQQPVDQQLPDAASPRPAAPSSILPHELPPGVQVVSVYAHVHYFSLHDARAAKKALQDCFIHSCRIRATFSSRPPPAALYTQLPFHPCLSLMNGMLGWSRWSCGVKWLAAYDVALHGHIVAGQTAGQCGGVGAGKPTSGCEGRTGLARSRVRLS